MTIEEAKIELAEVEAKATAALIPVSEAEKKRMEAISIWYPFYTRAEKLKAFIAMSEGK